MAAFEEHLVGNELGAAFLDELDRVVAAVSDDAEEVRVVDAEAVLQAVLDEELLAVLDALSSLNGVVRAGDVAAADGGVAADDGHLFNHEDLLAAFGRLKGAGHAGKARADDHDIELFVILLHALSGDSAVSSSARNNGSGGGSAGLKQIAAIEIRHLFPLFALSAAVKKKVCGALDKLWFRRHRSAAAKHFGRGVEASVIDLGVGQLAYFGMYCFAMCRRGGAEFNALCRPGGEGLAVERSPRRK